MIRISIKVSSRYPIERRRIRSLIKNRLKKHGIVDEVEVGVEVVGDRKMRQLNRQFLNHDSTTDVLSFPLAETTRRPTTEEKEFASVTDNLQLGDIVISYPQARKQAQENDLLVDEEVDRLVEHGLDHLLGIHHG